jgi:hypothetical protein
MKKSKSVMMMVWCGVVMVWCGDGVVWCGVDLD